MGDQYHTQDKLLLVEMIHFCACGKICQTFVESIANKWGQSGDYLEDNQLGLVPTGKAMPIALDARGAMRVLDAKVIEDAPNEGVIITAYVPDRRLWIHDRIRKPKH